MAKAVIVGSGGSSALSKMPNAELSSVLGQKKIELLLGVERLDRQAVGVPGRSVFYPARPTGV